VSALADGELLYEVRGQTGWITLNRPRARNALTFAMYEGVAEICAGLATGGPVRALVVIGAGEKAFAAGTDMNQFQRFDQPGDALAYEARMDRAFSAVERCGVPTLAAIAGACTGGGAGLAAACDLRIATAGLRFGFPIARTLGNCLSVANLARLCALIGAGRVADVIFTARLVGAEEALSIGLLSEIVPDHAALVERAGELAGMLAGHAPLTLRATKEGLRRLRTEGARARDDDLIEEVYMSRDFREGLAAFLSKRKPEWMGE
jgi:enoyl-CoA hydratase/carnithine racemase